MMKNTLENKNEVIQYLYGELSDTELNKFEDRLFADENFSLFVDEVENDLIDEYIRGELEFEKKREFEKKYLTTESRHEKIALARTLHNEFFDKETFVSNEESESKVGFLAKLLHLPNLALAGGLAAIILMVLLGGIWLTTQPDGNSNLAQGGNENTEENLPVENNPPEEISPTSVESPIEKPQQSVNKTIEENDTNKVNTKSEQSNSKRIEKKPTPTPLRKKPKPVKEPKKVQPQPKVFAFSMLPPLRSSQTPVLKIPQTAEIVRLQLFDNFGDTYERFIIELNNANGITVWNQEIKAAKKRPQKSISISIPKIKFSSGNHEIAVKGITKEGSVEEINFYNFVVKQE